MELNNLFKKKILNDLFTKYDFIKTLLQENEKNSDYEELKDDKNSEINKNKKKCMRIIERLKFIFDQIRNNHKRSVNNLAIYIDKFLLKRKIDIRADLKAVTNRIKENESLNALRNKDIRNTLDDLKYKIKGYSAKKEKNNNENETFEIKGRRINFDEIEEIESIEQKEEKKENIKEEKQK